MLKVEQPLWPSVLQRPVHGQRLHVWSCSLRHPRLLLHAFQDLCLSLQHGLLLDNDALQSADDIIMLLTTSCSAAANTSKHC